MSAHSVQAPSAVVMVRPHAFRSNPDTLGDNAFQQRGGADNAGAVAEAAYREVSTMARRRPSKLPPVKYSSFSSSGPGAVIFMFNKLPVPFCFFLAVPEFSVTEISSSFCDEGALIRILFFPVVEREELLPADVLPGSAPPFSVFKWVEGFSCAAELLLPGI